MFNRFWDNLPESVQIGVIIVLLFVVPALLFYFTAHFEGLASIFFIIAGIAFYKTSQKNLLFEHYGFTIGFIILFAILGIVFDGAGNFIYNKPFENLCPANTKLIRDVEVVEGATYEDDDVYVHQFRCFSTAENTIIYEIPRWKTSGIRFLEYVLIAAIFVGFYWVLSKFGTKKKG